LIGFFLEVIYLPNRKSIQLGILFFLLFGLIFTTASAFSYWQEVTVSDSITIGTIREGIDIEVVNVTDLEETVRLVPKGYAMFVGDVDEIELFYNVSVTRELLNTVDLYILVSNVTIGGSDMYEQLVDIDVNNTDRETTMDIFNDTVTVRVLVQLIEPIDEAEALRLGLDFSRVNVEDGNAAYNAIKGQDISFTVRFELRNKTE
jgi:hypothetical protein